MSGQSGHRGRRGTTGRKIGGGSGGSGESILAVHGGYRSLRSFQVAQLVYDLTVRFCERYVPRGSRTRDQMVQAARSGVQNIAEGSEASATSKKMELKLTQVARASLEELKLDYEDYLRQHGLSRWDRTHPLRQALVDAKCRSADDVAQWVVMTARELCRERVGDGPSGLGTSTGSSGSTPSTFYPELSANTGFTLSTVAGYLLDRQVQALAACFYMNLEGNLCYDRQYLPEKILSVRILDSFIFVGYAPDSH